MRTSRLTALAWFAVLALALAACGGGDPDPATSEPGGTDASDPEVTDSEPEDGESAAPDAGTVGFDTCDAEPNTCNGGEVEQGGSYTHTIEKDVLNWNLLSVDGNTFDYGQVLNGLYPGVFTSLPDFTVVVNENLMVSAEQTNDNPQTIEYVVRPEAVWSDGEPVDFDDFEYIWKTLNAKDCKKCLAASTSGYDQIKTLEGSEDGKTITLTFKKPYTDWKSLFSQLLPVHIAEKEADITTPDGLAKTFNGYFSKTVPTWTMGPYSLEKYEGNTAATLVPNDKYYGEDTAKFDKLVFRVITDTTQEPTALQNNEVQGIYPQPQVDMVEQVQQIPDVSYRIGKGLVWEHFDLNMDNEFFKQGDEAGDALRRAIFVATDRAELIEKTVGQFAPDIAPIDNHNFMPGQDGYEDVVPDEQGSGDTDAAIKILEDAGYTGIGETLTTPDGKKIPPFRFRYTTGNTIRQQEGELLASYIKPLGLSLKIQPTDDLGGTLGEGDFDIIVFAWVGTPFPFTGAQQLWSSGSGSNFTKFESKDSDKLLADAAANTDPVEAAQQLNESNKILAEANAVLPLYQKPTFLAVYNTFANIRDNATAVGPTYNVGEWGQRAQVQ